MKETKTKSKTKEIARIAAEAVKRVTVLNPELGAQVEGDCVVVIGVEPLCRNARAEFGTPRGVIKIDEEWLQHSQNKAVRTRCMTDAVGKLFACSWNGRHHLGISSYVGDRGSGVGNRRGCLGFNVRRKFGLFGWMRNWARCYVSVFCTSLSDEQNESLACFAARYLMELAEQEETEEAVAPAKVQDSEQPVRVRL